MTTIICPNCNIGLEIKYEEEIKFYYCSRCGYKKAMTEDNSNQTKLK